MKKLVAWAFAIGVVHLLSAVEVRAAENIKPAGPIGGTDIRQALLPPPGLYGVGVGVGLSLPTWWGSDRNYDAHGGSWVFGGGFMAVYPVQVLGGSLGSTLFLSAQKTCFGLKGMSKTRSEGFGDIYSDILMWSRFFPSGAPKGQEKSFIPYGLAVLVGLGMNFPTGEYDSSQGVNVGANFYDIAPNLALTYTLPSLLGRFLGDATELSARMFFNTYTKNPKTDYQTGELVNVDFAVTQRIAQWQLGLNGTGFMQIASDKNSEGTVPDSRGKSFSLGPIVSYDFFLGGRPWNVSVKGLLGVTGENTAKANGAVLRIGTQIF